jgi:hypothetical protein
MTRRLVAIPDNDQGEVTAPLGVLEEVLIALVDHDGEGISSGVLADGSALAALQRLLVAVVDVERGPAAQPLAPDGRFELIPLRFATMGEADLRLVGEALAVLGRATVGGGEDFVVETLGAWADAELHHRGSAGDLVANFARAHGVLDLATDADAELLASRLQLGSGRVVLTTVEYEAYERLTGRIMAMLYGDDPLARFLFRGA